MAIGVTTIPTELVKKLWSKQLWMEVQEDLFFKRFIGEGEASVIQKVSDLKKDNGDQITIPLLMKLSGSGISGDNTLEGNEEQMTFYSMPVTVDQIRHAVRLKGKMEEQKSAVKLRTAAKTALKTWMVEYIEKRFFTTLGTSPTANRTVWGGASSVDTLGEITAAAKLTTTLISTAKRKAMMATPKIRPVRVDGREYYVMVVHPYAARDLKTDNAWLSAQQYANLRGDANNPIFTGALGIWDGVALWEHPWVRLTTEGSSSANCCFNMLLGAQAGAWAVAKEAFWEEDDFDYHNSVGFATGVIDGFRKSQFGASGSEEDFGVITVITGGASD
jgi:N4-gp56 family major capsid protein